MSHQDPDAPRTEGGSFTDVPEPVVDLCRSLTDFVERAVGIRPDYTPETLPLVDHYLTQARQLVSERPEVFDLTAQAIGAYFGEVVRRSLAGFWLVPGANYHDWQVCGSAAFVAFNPIGVGYDAVMNGPTHGGPSSQYKVAPEDQQGVSDRLALLPPLPEDEYYLLSTRHEVLEIVYEAVRSHAMQRGYDETFYSVDDYASPLRPLDA